VALPAAVRWCDAFVFVPITWWYASTWMMIEADEAIRRTRAEPGFGGFAWIPRDAEPPVVFPGGLPYLKRARLLLGDPREAAAALIRHARRGAAHPPPT
jgi:hypothetical protein